MLNFEKIGLDHIKKVPWVLWYANEDADVIQFDCRCVKQLEG